jgi:hypothetical protein
MITAVDTNILLDILLPDESFYEASVLALEGAASSGSLVICDLVYAELCIHFLAQRVRRLPRRQRDPRRTAQP